MANTTLGAAAVVTGMEDKMVAACSGKAALPGCSIKSFTAVAGTGNYPIAGLTLDLSALFPNKVLAVVCGPLYDPAVASADLAFTTVYVPGTAGNPATGKLYVYAATGIMTADDAVAITGYVVSGIAIGY